MARTSPRLNNRIKTGSARLPGLFPAVAFALPDRYPPRTRPGNTSLADYAYKNDPYFVSLAGTTRPVPKLRHLVPRVLACYSGSRKFFRICHPERSEGSGFFSRYAPSE